MEIFQKILDTLNSVPADVWADAVNVIVSAIIVSPTALALKQWWNVNNEKIMVTIVILGSMVAAAIAYLQTTQEFGPWFVAVQGWLTFAATQPVYYFFVKPLWKRLIVWFEVKVAEAAALNDTRSAQVPADGLNISKNEQI